VNRLLFLLQGVEAARELINRFRVLSGISHSVDLIKMIKKAPFKVLFSLRNNAGINNSFYPILVQMHGLKLFQVKQDTVSP
jgi:hypothetical protein